MNDFNTRNLINRYWKKKSSLLLFKIFKIFKSKDLTSLNKKHLHLTTENNFGLLFRNEIITPKQIHELPGINAVVFILQWRISFILQWRITRTVHRFILMHQKFKMKQVVLTHNKRKTYELNADTRAIFRALPYLMKWSITYDCIKVTKSLSVTVLNNFLSPFIESHTVIISNKRKY